MTLGKMKYSRMLAVAVTVVACEFGGCTSSTRTIADPKFGSLPSDYRKTISDWLTTRGRIAPSDVIRMEVPRGGVVQANSPEGLKNYFGWVVHVSADPKIKPPTYIGPHNFYFMFGADGHFGDVTDAWVRGFAAFAK